MGAADDPPAHAARAAPFSRLLGAEQGLGEGDSGQLFAHAVGAAEQVSVVDRTVRKGGAEKLDRAGLSDDVGERHAFSESLLCSRKSIAARALDSARAERVSVQAERSRGPRARAPRPPPGNTA